MALTFVQLKNKVLAWLDDGDSDTAPSERESLVEEALNEADARRSAGRYPFMSVEPALTFTLVPGQQTYTLDATFNIPIYFWNRSTKSPLVQYNEEEVPTRDSTGGLIDDYYTSNPMYGHFVLKGQTLKLLWTPTAADVIEYGFYKLPVEMSADADLPNIPYPHSRMLIYDALMTLAAYDEDIATNKVTLWQKNLDQWVDSFEEKYGQENSDQTAARYITYIPRD
jgi:hypothetical protein